MTKGFQDSVLDLKNHDYWGPLFKVDLCVKKSCYKAILSYVYLRPKMFFALLIFCIRQVCSPAGWVHNMQKTPRWRLQFHENRQRGMFWEPRPPRRRATGRRRAWHRFHCLLVPSPFQTAASDVALNKRTFATKSSDFRVSFSKRFISDFDQRPDGQF